MSFQDLSIQKSSNTFSSRQWWGLLLVGITVGWGMLFLFLPFGGAGKLAKEQKVNFSFLPNDHDYVLAFFGEPGCSLSCPVILSQLKDVYLRYQNMEANQRLQVVFLSMKPDVDSTLPELYAQNFHPDFKGYPLTPAERNEAVRSLGAHAVPSFGKSDALSHTNYVYLLENRNQSWFLTQIYLTVDSQKILQDLVSSHQES